MFYSENNLKTDGQGYRYSSDCPESQVLILYSSQTEQNAKKTPAGTFPRGKAYSKVYIYNADFSQQRTSTNYSNTLLYTGRELDTLDSGDLKLQYNRNRYYSSRLGRWMTQDPLGITPNGQFTNNFQVTEQFTEGLNIYNYAISNPVINLDEYGLYSLPPGPTDPSMPPMPPPPPPSFLHQACDNYDVHSCCDVGFRCYDDEAKAECHREADLLEQRYRDLIQNYWDDAPAYTQCREYANLIHPRNPNTPSIAGGMKYLSLKSTARTNLSLFGIEFMHAWVGVFHVCNDSNTSDASLDPFSFWPFPGFYNRGRGDTDIQPPSSCPPNHDWVF